MTKTIDRVMEMVRRALDKDPDARSGTLYDQAKKVDRRVGQLSLRQFHALYPLTVKRQQAGSRRARKKTATAGATAKRGRAAGSGRGPGRPPGSGRPGRARRSRSAPETAATITGTGSGDRDNVRGVVLELVAAVARAEDKADLIKVLGEIDGWVDRLVRAAR
jgi:hypothetical protein